MMTFPACSLKAFMEMKAFCPVHVTALPSASVCGVLTAQRSQLSRCSCVRVVVQRETRVAKKAVIAWAKAEPGLTGMARRRMYWP